MNKIYSEGFASYQCENENCYLLTINSYINNVPVIIKCSECGHSVILTDITPKS